MLAQLTEVGRQEGQPAPGEGAEEDDDEAREDPSCPMRIEAQNV